MKKNLLILMIICMVLQVVTLDKSFAAEKTVKVTLPTFRVVINGTEVNSKKSVYPLLVYKDITYMPMTFEYCNLLGLTSNWTSENGLVVSLRKNNEIPTVSEYKEGNNNPFSMNANIVSTAITLNGKKLDNTKEPYPFLRFRDVTYFPLTFKFTKEMFNIYSNFLPECGLGVYSENKFFYQYYPPNSKVQNTDLRLTNILYYMMAIQISDGTDQYPTNNLQQTNFYRPGKIFQANVKGIKHYGFLPDGKGGLKVNTASKAMHGNLITTEIADLGNPVAKEVEMTFYEFYNEEE